MSFSLQELSDTKQTTVLLGEVPGKIYPLLAKELNSYETLIFKELREEKKTKYILLIFLKKDKETILPLLKKYSFIQISLPSVPTTPQELLAKMNRELKEIERNMQKLGEKAKSMAEDFINLVILSDYYESIQNKEEAKKYFLKTKSSFYLTGWILANKREEVKENLEREFPEIEILFSDPQKGEDIPVALENRKVVEPFEVITDLYGRPFYYEVDPTPILAIFFAVFFGLCLTDAGYGVIICLLAGFILLYYRKKIDRQIKKFISLFLLGGIFTTLMGAMVGGWFGITVKWQLFDPLKDLKIFFTLALSLGIIHIITGL